METLQTNSQNNAQEEWDYTFKLLIFQKSDSSINK